VSEINRPLLSVELVNGNDQVEIHCNEEGLSRLIEKLESLRTKQGDHIHLRAAEIGGNDLTDDLVGVKNKKIVELKVFNW